MPIGCPDVPEVSADFSEARKFIGNDIEFHRDGNAVLVINRVSSRLLLLDLSAIETNDLDAATRLIERLLNEAGEALSTVDLILTGFMPVLDGEVADWEEYDVPTPRVMTPQP